MIEILFLPYFVMISERVHLSPYLLAILKT